MPGSNNFLQWNPGKANQESDAVYAGDAQRLSGATAPSLFASILANKLFYQNTTFNAALGQALANKGYNVSDADITALIAVFANVITAVDLIPYATLASPHFTNDPQCPTPPVGDNDFSLANTAFVKAVLGAPGGFSILLGTNGYIKFPSVLGGLVIQWATGPVNPPTGETDFSINFPLTFPTACYNVQASVLAPGVIGHEADSSYEVISFSTVSVHIKLQEFSNGRDIATQCMIIAIGS